MGFLADRVQRIKASPTSMAASRIKELRAEGRGIIGLTTGEPDFDTPAHIVEAAYRSMKSGQTRYTQVDGTPELKRAIIEKFKRENELTYTPDQILVGTGGKQIVYNALAATVQRNDEVIIPAPCWVSYPDMTLLNGGTPVHVICSSSQGYKLQPDALEAAITPRTKWLLLNSPCNPTGAAYSRSELRALGEVLLRHPHVWVMSDDIYEHLVYDGFQFSTVAQVVPELFQRTLTVNGVSKAFAMTGWRIGYAGAPRDLIKAMTKLQSQSTSCASAIGQAAALAALTGPMTFLDEWRAQYTLRRDTVLARFNQMPGLRCTKPEGAFYLYPECADLIGKRTATGQVIDDDSALVLHLLDSQGVGVVQGTAFGLGPAFRVSFATSLANLNEACDRIGRALAALT